MYKKRIALNKIPINEAELIRMYEVDRGSVRYIAEKYRCTVQAVYYRLKLLGVQRRKGGDASKGTQAREKNPNWGGGKTYDAAGYVKINVGNGKQRREHRIIAEQILGRPLLPREVVHHKNGIRSDNSPENLEIHASHSEHMKHHMTSEEARCRALKTKKAKLAALKACGVKVGDGQGEP